MGQELGALATAIITSLAALGGVALAWALSNISSESAARRLERQDARHRLEDKYVQVLADIDFFLRSSRESAQEINERLAHIGASVGIFAGLPVAKCYNDLADSIHAMERVLMGKGNKSLFDFAVDYPELWEDVVRCQQKLMTAMQAETRALRNF